MTWAVDPVHNECQYCALFIHTLASPKNFLLPFVRPDHPVPLECAGFGGGTRTMHDWVMGWFQSHIRRKYLACQYRYDPCSLLALVVNPRSPKPGSSHFLRLKSELDMQELVRNNLTVCHRALDLPRMKTKTSRGLDVRVSGMIKKVTRLTDPDIFLTLLTAHLLVSC